MGAKIKINSKLIETVNFWKWDQAVEAGTKAIASTTSLNDFTFNAYV